MSRFVLFAFAAGLIGTHNLEARGQYSAISAPFGTAGSTFSENIGVGWGVSGPNFFFNNGGGGALPPFGGHNPGADGALGFGLRGNGYNFNFNLTAGQGSSTTIGSQTPTIVVPNGVPGSLFSGQQRPFVTSIIPIVGAGPAVEAPPPSVISPLAERLSRLQAEQTINRAAARSRRERAQAERKAAAAAPSSPAEDDPPLILGARGR